MAKLGSPHPRTRQTKPNCGNVSEHPELFDVNYIHGDENQVSQLMATKDGRDKLRSWVMSTATASPDDAKTGSPRTRRRSRR